MRCEGDFLEVGYMGMAVLYKQTMVLVPGYCVPGSLCENHPLGRILRISKRMIRRSVAHSFCRAHNAKYRLRPLFEPIELSIKTNSTKIFGIKITRALCYYTTDTSTVVRVEVQQLTAVIVPFVAVPSESYR
jgi:hypothetical protein